MAWVRSQLSARGWLLPRAAVSLVLWHGIVRSSSPVIRRILNHAMRHKARHVRYALTLEERIARLSSHDHSSYKRRGEPCALTQTIGAAKDGKYGLKKIFHLSGSGG